MSTSLADMFFLKQSAKKNMEWLVVATRWTRARDAIHLRKKRRWGKAGGVCPTRLPFGEKPRWQAPAEQCLPAARPASPALGACGATPLVSACGALRERYLIKNNTVMALSSIIVSIFLTIRGCYVTHNYFSTQ